MGADEGQAPEVTLFDLTDYDKRNRGLVLSEQASGKKALVIGCGSVGSRIAEALAKHGVLTTVVDCDTFETHNLYRHGQLMAPQACVGRSKAHVLRDELRSAIPGAQVTAHHRDFCEELAFFMDLIEEEDYALIVVTTDTVSSHCDAMVVAHRTKTPILYCLLGDGAESVMVAYYTPEHDCCHLCFTGEQSQSLFAAKEDNKVYGVDAGEEQHGVPALSVDISIGAGIGSKVALAALSDATPEYMSTCGNVGHVMFFSTTPGWIFDDAFQKVCVQVEKNPECPICGTPDLERIRQRHAKSPGGVDTQHDEPAVTGVDDEKR